MNKMGLGDPDPSNYKRGLMVQKILEIGLRKTNQMIGSSVTEKITPETYEKMNEEFEEEGLAFESLFLHKKKLMIGDNGTKYLKNHGERTN